MIYFLDAIVFAILLVMSVLRLLNKQTQSPKNETFYGNELVRNTFKMALMNLYLHDIGDRDSLLFSGN